MLETVAMQQLVGGIAAPTEPRAEPAAVGLRKQVGQIVLVLQGGGALGAYQVGVYQALHEAGIEPDWIIGTSIGAINASLIAGNMVENRLPRLREFWSRVDTGCYSRRSRRCRCSAASLRPG
jgi:NTE family protein